MPEETSITFDTIRKIQIEERTFIKLSKLPANFYESMNKYIAYKRNLGEGQKDAEIKNTERIIEDIINRRERKILNHALTTARTKIPPENLTEEEKEFFDEVIYIISKRRDGLFGKVSGKKKRGKTVRAVFKDYVDEFVGSDMNSYGPFKAKDEAEIPEENFKILLERNVVEEM